MDLSNWRVAAQIVGTILAVTGVLVGEAFAVMNVIRPDFAPASISRSGCYTDSNLRPVPLVEVVLNARGDVRLATISDPRFAGGQLTVSQEGVDSTVIGKGAVSTTGVASVPVTADTSRSGAEAVIVEVQPKNGGGPDICAAWFHPLQA